MESIVVANENAGSILEKARCVINDPAWPLLWRRMVALVFGLIILALEVLGIMYLFDLWKKL